VRARGSGDIPCSWLAVRVWALLEEKYGHGMVPAVRTISADIRATTGGETISHGHINNILLGEANNLTDGKRRVLAAFFGKHPSVFDPPSEDFGASIGVTPTSVGPGPDARLVRALACRFAALEPAQISAIEEAIRIAKGGAEADDWSAD
jgi:hypothetical protein